MFSLRTQWNLAVKITSPKISKEKADNTLQFYCQCYLDNKKGQADNKNGQADNRNGQADNRNGRADNRNGRADN